MPVPPPKRAALTPELQLALEFADLLGIRDWYEWRPDPGHHAYTEWRRLRGLRITRARTG